jgi:hypothetical protein
MKLHFDANDQRILSSSDRILEILIDYILVHLPLNEKNLLIREINNHYDNYEKGNELLNIVNYFGKTKHTIVNKLNSAIQLGICESNIYVNEMINKYTKVFNNNKMTEMANILYETFVDFDKRTMIQFLEQKNLDIIFRDYLIHVDNIDRLEKLIYNSIKYSKVFIIYIENKITKRKYIMNLKDAFNFLYGQNPNNKLLEFMRIQCGDNKVNIEVHLYYIDLVLKYFLPLDKNSELIKDILRPNDALDDIKKELDIIYADFERDIEKYNSHILSIDKLIKDTKEKINTGNQEHLYYFQITALELYKLNMPTLDELHKYKDKVYQLKSLAIAQKVDKIDIQKIIHLIKK